jgi:hypothetical protein
MHVSCLEASLKSEAIGAGNNTSESVTRLDLLCLAQAHYLALQLMHCVTLYHVLKLCLKSN